ncbi:MAG: hypothetical protein JSR83_26905 [Proteobacteria bacterium]|nr:hypothetical protein [Pseudomonadota bacterium]
MHTTSPGAAAPKRITLTDTITFLEARLLDSRQQAEKETGFGKAFYEGRVSAFELALSELREVAK